MNSLAIDLKNCYGIKSLSHTFTFALSYKRRAYAIYAPNGLMKSSFAKTFERLSNGEQPQEPRFQKTPLCDVTLDGQNITKQSIFVLKADIDTKAETPAVTNLLVKPEEKNRYDALVLDLDKQKQKAINALQKISGVKKADIETQLLRDFGTSTFVEGVRKGLQNPPQESVSVFTYSVLFNPKSLGVIQSPSFQEKATDFNHRYEELFQSEKTIYKKGVFNPGRAGAAFNSLQKERFFEAGHRVHLEGDAQPLNQEQLDERLQELHSRIDGDESLKKIRDELAKTAETRDLTELLESLDAHQFEYLAEMTKPQSLDEFRRELWRYYLSEKTETSAYLEESDRISAEVAEIESQAATLVPEWHIAVNRFNQRFVNMPFTLRIANEAEASLGKAPARLLFIFSDDVVGLIEVGKEEVMRTLSQGERRALHLLSFIFEVESRKKSGQPTIFISDDPADSFDYKNKHAIVQYLEDLTKVDHFRQIILTHNFDLFRTLTRFSHRDHCLAAIRCADDGIALKKMEGVENIFIKMWKGKIMESADILIATIPFTRNLIEYTRGDTNDEYLELTSLLHWKSDSMNMTVGKYLTIYNEFFATNHNHPQEEKFVYELIMERAEIICGLAEHNELQLENKIVLSIATRILAEQCMTDRLRILKADPNYWCQSTPPFGMLLNEIKTMNDTVTDLELMECIGVTVSSNIHLNSFMYEPLLDLSVGHLADLFGRTKTNMQIGNNA